MPKKLNICRRKRERSNLRYYPAFEWRNLKRPREISATLIGAPAEITTDYPLEYNSEALSHDPTGYVRRSRIACR
jgi:hypothetical protein